MEAALSDDDPERPLWQRILLHWVLPIAGAAVLFVVIGQLRGPSLEGPAPNFNLPTVAGDRVDLRELRGKPVVLNFWATWCGPCRVELPSFAAFAKNRDDIQVLGIAADGPGPRVQSVADQAGVTYPLLLGDRETLRAYGVTAFPTTVVLDAEGQVVSTHTGTMLRPQLWWATFGLGGS